MLAPRGEVQSGIHDESAVQAAFSSPEALLRTFPLRGGCELAATIASSSTSAEASKAALEAPGIHCGDFLGAFDAVRASGSDAVRVAVRRALLAALERAQEQSGDAQGVPKRRRRLKGPADAGGSASRAPAESYPCGWLPVALSAALPLLSGALPRDERGICVIPHPHPLVQKRSRLGSGRLDETGRLVYNSKRACDNCDREIKDRSWFACAHDSCEIDFCTRCHNRLQEVFSGRDIEIASWAAQFVARAATFILCVMTPVERGLLIRDLAFEWPVIMFEQLVRIVADVADAKVVHVEDERDIKNDAEFWHVVGFLQLLCIANELPAQELRFGELALRGPRVPSDYFLLRAIDKCDADSEWNRWKFFGEKGSSTLEMVLSADPFELSDGFALFLAHGNLVPIGFRLRCLFANVGDTMDERDLHLEVSREPEEIFEAVVASFGRHDAELPYYLSGVGFLDEPAVGPGVTREFLGLAVRGILNRPRSSNSLSESSDEVTSRAIWEYDPELRTYWFREPLVDAPEVAHACGALLGHAVATGTHVPAAFPRVLYALLLSALGSSRVPSLTLADVALVRPSLAQGLQQLLEYEGSNIADMFPLDWPRADELAIANRQGYVDAYVNWFFKDRFAVLLIPLCGGFRAVVGHLEMLHSLVDPAQLEQIICGVAGPPDIGAIRRNAEAVGWSLGDKEYIDAFWDILSGFSDAEQLSFIIFVSACGRMPPQGWQDFTFRIQKNGSGDDRLPTAYTCFHLLLLPRYTSEDVLRARLQAAITQTEGFGLN